MGAMKDLLIGEIEELSKEAGYSFELLMDSWFEHGGTEGSWEAFKAEVRAHPVPKGAAM